MVEDRIPESQGRSFLHLGSLLIDRTHDVGEKKGHRKGGVESRKQKRSHRGGGGGGDYQNRRRRQSEGVDESRNWSESDGEGGIWGGD